MFDKLIQDAKKATDVLSLRRVVVSALEEMQKGADPAPKPTTKKKASS